MASRFTLSLSLNPEEWNLLEILKTKGIRVVDVFRRGLAAYEADLMKASDGEKGA